MWQGLDGQVHSAAARIGQQQLQWATAHSCSRANVDLKGIQPWLDKELATAHPPTLPNDLPADAAFQWEMSIESINASAIFLDPMSSS